MNLFDIILGIVLIVGTVFIIYKNRKKIKQTLQKKIEINAIKIPNVTWKDKKGRTHIEDIVIKRSYAKIPILGNLIGDWTRVYPPIDEEGKVNWINTIFGSKQNFVRLLVILGIVAIIFLAFAEIFYSYEQLKEMCEPFLNAFP